MDEIAIALAAFALGQINRDNLVRLLRKLDAFLYNHWERYGADRKTAERKRAERREKEEQMLAEAYRSGRTLYPSDMAFVHCGSCSQLLKGWSYRDENNNCPKCSHLLSLRSEREIAIHAALLQVSAINNITNTLNTMIERDMRKEQPVEHRP